MHTIDALVEGAWSEVARFDGFTETGQVFDWSPDQALQGVSALRINTLESPSWPEWHEIEILTEPDTSQ